MSWSQSGSINIPGIVHHESSPDNLEHHPTSRPRLLIVMVGLPARGKSYIAKKLARYLNWLQYPTRIFNVGERRRLAEAPNVTHTAGSKIDPTNGLDAHDARLFDPNCTSAQKWREHIAMATLDELLDWFDQPGATVGIFDATNSTTARRHALLDRIHTRAPGSLDVLFLESICENPTVLERNMRLKLFGPDYASQASDIALDDLKKRIDHYTSAYIPIGDAEVSSGVPFIRVFDTGRQITINRVQSFLSMVALDYLLSFHLERRRIWLTCNGQSVDDVEGKIGRQSELSDEGVQYSLALADFMRQQEVSSAESAISRDESTHAGKRQSPGFKLNIWTSMMTQSIQTARGFPPNKVIKMKMLEDLGAGDMRGMTYEQIKERYPAAIAARERDTVSFRWPGVGGEAYADVINRLRTVVLELERSRDNILVISHRAIVRVLLTYFMGLDKSRLTSLKIPHGSLFSIEPGAYTAKAQMYCFDPPTGKFADPVEFNVEL